MADLTPYPDSKGDTGKDAGVRPDRESKPRMPRWVKVGIIVGALILLVVILTLTGVHSGGPGPGGHSLATG